MGGQMADPQGGRRTARRDKWGSKMFLVPKSNITIEKFKALMELRQDKSHFILTAAKGLGMVVLDKQDHMQKVKNLLELNTQRTLSVDPTNKQNKVVKLLTIIKVEGGIGDNTYKRIYPIGVGSSKFYGLPKIHKKNIHSWPTVSSRSMLTYGVSK